MTCNTRRNSLIAGGAVVVLAVGTFAATQMSSSAAGALTIAPNVTSATTLNYAKATNGSSNLPQRLADATFCLRVPDSKTVHGLRLDYLSYTEPADIDPSMLPGYARLVYRQVGTNSATVPASGWKPLDLPVVGNPGPVNSGSVLRANGRNVCLSATIAGEYKVRFVDPGEEAGEDDDVRSQVVTLTVKDAYKATMAALSDDWKPGLTTTPQQIALGGSATGKLTTGLSTVDSRGSSAGVGVLQNATTGLLAMKFVSADPGDALDQDLNKASVFGANKLGVFGPVTVTGTRDVPALYRGYKVVKHVGEFGAVTGFDRDGNGQVTAAEAIQRTLGDATTSVVTKLAKPQAKVSAFTAKSAKKKSVYLHIEGTKGNWVVYRNGQKLTSGYGSYLSWTKVVPSGTSTFTARVSATGYTTAEQSVVVTVK